MNSLRECQRCSANTKQSVRCKRRTCKYTNYCFQHTKDFVVKQTTLPFNGLGLFAKRNFRTGQIIAMYTCLLMTTDEFDAKSSAYGVQVNDEFVIDARSTKSSIARYINDCRDIHRQYCTDNNSRMVIDPIRRTVKIKATKRIIAGDEIFFSYGIMYGNKKDHIKTFCVILGIFNRCSYVRIRVTECPQNLVKRILDSFDAGVKWMPSPRRPHQSCK
jgi:uncharacterized protein